MMTAQFLSLTGMFLIGVFSAPRTVDWENMSRRKRVLVIAWLIFWLGPPLYFIWTKGVLG